MIKRYPIIAKEGWLFVGLSFLAALAASLLCAPVLLIAFLWVLFALVLQFFRDPHRTVTAPPNAIVSPADGKIIVVETATDPYHNDREAIRISVFMNVFNVHCNRSPYDGTVIDRRYFRGSFLKRSPRQGFRTKRTQRNGD
jgi:phosphatidylserine decarboxylase